MGSRKYRNRPVSSKKATADSLQRLGEKYVRKHGPGGGFVISQENKKLSAAIIDIAQPLLDRAETPEDIKGVLHMALVAWMTAVLPEDHGGPNMPEYSKWFAAMILTQETLLDNDAHLTHIGED